ncbi:MAG TPA: amino acid ABC transporter substrate-binding protein [Burkholderiales bacterium]|jgi:ABC-type amino acid transport substrate-binding protein
MPRLLLLAVLLIAAAASAQTLDKVRKSGSITLGFRPDAVPFSFVGADQQPSGFSVDLCRRVVRGLARDLKLAGLKTVWVPVTGANRIDLVASGKVDLECGTTTVTLGRQARVDFSLITFLDGGGFVARAGTNAPRSIKDTPGIRVAVSAGTTTEKALRKLVADNGTGAEVVVVPSHVDGVAQVIDGKVAMYAADRTVLIGLVMNAPRETPLQILDVMFSYEPYALMMRRDADFRLAVNRQLAEVFREGEIVGLYRSWFGRFGEPPELLRSLYLIQSFQE